jgi:hypothetical protein
MTVEQFRSLGVNKGFVLQRWRVGVWLRVFGRRPRPLDTVPQFEFMFFLGRASDHVLEQAKAEMGGTRRPRPSTDS